MNPLRHAINLGPHDLQVRFPAALGAVLGMGDGITENRFLAAYFAVLCHPESSTPQM